MKRYLGRFLYLIFIYVVFMSYLLISIYDINNYRDFIDEVIWGWNHDDYFLPFFWIMVIGFIVGSQVSGPRVYRSNEPYPQLKEESHD